MTQPSAIRQSPVRALWALCVALCAALVILAAPAAQAQDRRTIAIDGREMDLFSPRGMENARAPLLLVLHGGLSSAREFRSRYDIVPEATAAGVHVVYLNGTLQGRPRADRRVWNAGDCCANARDQNIDDVGFLADVITALVQAGLADPNQVWLLGSSNGGMMSYRFACERRSMIRGVVGLSVPIVIPVCDNASGVRILHVHGTADSTVPLEGGGRGDRLMGADFRSLEQTVGILRAGGAQVEVMLVPGAEHGAQEVDAGLRREMGVTLGQVTLQFMGLR
jgi:polyhydroxybutyrate depolymerase